MEDEIEVPSKTPISEAIFQKYQNQFDNPMNEVIKEEDEENENMTETNT